MYPWPAGCRSRTGSRPAACGTAIRRGWSSEDGIPEILAEQRLGHDVPGMRGLYAHASPRMRDELLAALQARWRNRCGSAPESIRTPSFRCSTACLRHYVLDGAPLWGISVYCALDDVGPASLDGLLRRLASYRAARTTRSGSTAMIRRG